MSENFKGMGRLVGQSYQVLVDGKPVVIIDPKSDYSIAKWREALGEMGGEVIVIDPKSTGKFNPFDIVVSGEKDANTVIDGAFIEKLVVGGFESLVEVLEITEKFHKTNDPIAKGIFNEWWEKDGSKDGILKLIEKLKL